MLSFKFSDLPGVECIVDDILVWGENDEQHDCRVRQMLQRCRQMNFKLNKSKFELRAPEVTVIIKLNVPESVSRVKS
jgi:hypothetical protein